MMVYLFRIGTGTKAPFASVQEYNLTDSDELLLSCTHVSCPRVRINGRGQSLTGGDRNVAKCQHVGTLQLIHIRVPGHTPYGKPHYSRTGDVFNQESISLRGIGEMKRTGLRVLKRILIHVWIRRVLNGLKH